VQAPIRGFRRSYSSDSSSLNRQKMPTALIAEDEHLLRTPLKDLLPRLSADEFWQIHRSTLVRADAIDTVRRDEAGKLHLTLRGCPDQLAVSRLYAHLFKAL